MHRVILIVLGLGLASTPACPTDEAAHAPGALRWERLDEAAGGWVVCDGELDLGVVGVGDRQTLRARVVNVGSRAATVSFGIAPDGALDWGTEAPTGAVVRPGGGVEVKVSVAGPGLCPATAVLTAVANDGGTVSLRLRAQGRDEQDATGALALEVADPARPRDWAPLEGAAGLSFDAVPAGGQAVRLVRLRGTPACPVAITGATVGAAADFALDTALSPLTLGEGAAVVLPIVFAPGTARAAARQGTLTLTTSAGTRSVALQGRVGAPELALLVGGAEGSEFVSPGALGLDFGAVAVGERALRHVRIVASGDGAVAVREVAVEVGAFTVGWGGGDGVLTLAPGATHDLEVAFLPDAPGSQLGELEVETAGGEVTLQLVGRGLAGVPQLAVEEPANSGSFTVVAGADTVDFGVVSPGNEAFRRFVLTNAGDGPLRAWGAEVGSGFRHFLPGAIALAPGAEREFLVRFRPVAAAASYEAALVVDTDRGTVAVGLRGALTAVCGAAVAAPTGPEGACVPDDETLCLLDGRFAVTAAHQTQACGGGVAQVAVAAPASGSFSLDGLSWGLTVNMVDACAGGGGFGFSAAGATRDRVELRVLDTVTGAVKTWFNPLGEPFQPLIDPAAFTTCP